ncbi:MAG: HAMP domain-containing protein [Arcobacter sp.]|nr:HAMP domain-containing protein [Arcobacter sp.]
MKTNKLIVRILVGILSSVILSFSLFYMLSNYELKKTINKVNIMFYSEKIDTIINSLKTKYDKLQRTQLPDSYEYSFKQFSVKELRIIHYDNKSKDVRKIYPFIINENKLFKMHPIFDKTQSEKYQSRDDFKKILKSKNGNFYTEILGVKKWIIYRHFKPWDWIVGYSIPLDIKYEEVNEFNQKYLILLFITMILMLIVTVSIVNYILRPIKELIRASKKIASGNLEHNIVINNSSYEFIQLTENFTIMKNKLKSNIHKLKDQVNERTKDLEASNSELKNSISNLKNMQEQLIESEKMASLGGLVSGVAHEINTPVGVALTGITHFQEITTKIKKDYDNEDISEEEFEKYLNTSNELSNIINTNLKRTADLVKSFKQVAVDQTSEKKRKFNVKVYLEEIITSIKNVLRQYKVKINVNVLEEIIINSYPGFYSQIITNLIFNSLRHAYEKEDEGLIDIEVSKVEDNILIEYSDDGKGIKEENLKKIFDPFFTTNREKGGTGLGLNIIYNIIKSNLNGEIICTSKENEGVKFTITLPREIDKEKDSHENI